MSTGILLCGIQLTLDGAEIGDIFSISSIGATKAVIDDPSSEEAGSFMKRISSCIATLKAFTIGIRFTPNYRIDQKILIGFKNCVISWPMFDNQTSATTWAFSATISDYDVSGSQIDERLTATVTLTPSGALTITPGATA